MMMRTLLGVFLGLCSLALVAADDADEMDWEDVDLAVVGDRSLEESGRFHYLMTVIENGVAILGVEDVIFEEVDVHEVPQDTENDEDADCNEDPHEGEPMDAAEETLVPEEPEGVYESPDMLERLRVLDQERQRLEARRNRLLYRLYATPEELERLVPDLELDEGPVAAITHADHELPFYQMQPVYLFSGAAGSMY